MRLQDKMEEETLCRELLEREKLMLKYLVIQLFLSITLMDDAHEKQLKQHSDIILFRKHFI